MLSTLLPFQTGNSWRHRREKINLQLLTLKLAFPGAICMTSSWMNRFTPIATFQLFQLTRKLKSLRIPNVTTTWRDAGWSFFNSSTNEISMRRIKIEILSLMSARQTVVEKNKFKSLLGRNEKKMCNKWNTLLFVLKYLNFWI